jgi:hypothetical protein
MEANYEVTSGINQCWILDNDDMDAAPQITLEGAREVPQQSLHDRPDDLENVHNDSPDWRSDFTHFYVNGSAVCTGPCATITRNS